MCSPKKCNLCHAVALLSSWAPILPTAKETSQQHEQEGNLSPWSGATEKKGLIPSLIETSHTWTDKLGYSMCPASFPNSHTAVCRRQDNQSPRETPWSQFLPFKLFFLQTFASLVYSSPEIPGYHFLDTIGMNFSQYYSTALVNKVLRSTSTLPSTRRARSFSRSTQSKY